MKLALDTNAYVDFCRGSASAVEQVQQAQVIALPFIVLGELRAGFQIGKFGLQNERILQQFLNSARVAVLFSDEDTMHHYARLFHQLRKQGTPLPSNDLWIAALALQHHFPLLTRDHHFEHLPQLSLVKI